MINTYLIEIAVAVGLLIGSYLLGSHNESVKWEQKVKVAQALVDQEKKRSEQITTQVKADYESRIAQINKDHEDDLARVSSDFARKLRDARTHQVEVPVPATCPVGATAPESGDPADAAAYDELKAAIAEEQRRFQLNSEKLEALQAWVKQQETN
jgi:hypothetical protein